MKDEINFSNFMKDPAKLAATTNQTRFTIQFRRSVFAIRLFGSTIVGVFAVYLLVQHSKSRYAKPNRKHLFVSIEEHYRCTTRKPTQRQVRQRH